RGRRAAGGAGRDRLERAQSRLDRPVRGRKAVRRAAALAQGAAALGTSRRRSSGADGPSRTRRARTDQASLTAMADTTRSALPGAPRLLKFDETRVTRSGRRP